MLQRDYPEICKKCCDIKDEQRMLKL
jgi:hypothetical protein